MLTSHPAVADACVAGVPDERSGERPKAWVVVSGPCDTRELYEYVEERVAPYKKLVAIEPIDELPRTMTGKLLRRVLLERERTEVAMSMAPSTARRRACRHDARPCRASPSRTTRSSASSTPRSATTAGSGRMTSRSRAPTRRCSRRPGSSPRTSATQLLSGLDQVAAELEGGTFPFAPDDVDIHMAVERRLTDLVGPVGGKLHTARSRNDQVATDLVLFTRAHADAALAGIAALRATLVELAERHLDWAMPGYTHLQRAQPVYLSHHLLAYFWMLGRDAQALRVRARGDRGAAARRRRAGGRELRHRPRAARRPARLRSASRRTRSTPSPTATSCSTT